MEECAFNNRNKSRGLEGKSSEKKEPFLDGGLGGRAGAPSWLRPCAQAVVRNKDNWGKRILDGTALEDNDDTFLGSNLDALHFLIYNDSRDMYFHS